MYENLVFKGGGVLGMAYAGALEVLEQENILANIKRIAGTSAGAITALALCIGYDYKDMKLLMQSTDFKKFQDETNYLKITHDYGLYKGNFLLTWIKEIIRVKNIDAELSFKDLHEMDTYELKVFATNINTTNFQEFSFNKTPDVKIAEAVRASMSIPFFFNAWQFPNGEFNKHIFIDGGVLNNYPIFAFENLEKTLGLYINTEDKDDDLEFNEITKFIKRLFKAVVKGQDVEVFRTQKIKDQTIFLDNLQISTTHFEITDEEKEDLYTSAKEMVTNFLKNKH